MFYMIFAPLLSLQSCLESLQVYQKIPDFIFEMINQNKKGELQSKVFVLGDRHQVYHRAEATLELGSGKVGLSSVCPGWKGSLRIESTHCKIIRHAMLIVKGLS